MKGFQYGRVPRKAAGLWFGVGLAGTLFAVCGAQAAGHGPVRVKGTKPPLVLRQYGRVTYLEGSGLKLALTHPGVRPQGLNAPFGAAQVFAKPGHVLIFTDSFASNPGNVQGECGASETGERYLHVLALGQPKETLSVLVESCWLNMVPAHAPKWDAAAGTVTVDLLSNDKGPLHSVYRVGADGAVKH
ncbi:hypothetical protein [Granulicella tundricola]|uniref:Uncharacterized protein n=1 Tax=Granulicella tundricola (strain ATCC BAA-1859 / DSM 23138 / MP5ACTX9) TaxID=1198114 RepID=E8X5N7_GRATM|nr:hypothetical protein [Granulicella tundricola]ADW70664.1 hypothetical protein AciX9_3663 [Granulicella tundricola MP5ACTX9]